MCVLFALLWVDTKFLFMDCAYHFIDLKKPSDNRIYKQASFPWTTWLQLNKEFYAACWGFYSSSNGLFRSILLIKDWLGEMTRPAIFYILKQVVITLAWPAALLNLLSWQEYNLNWCCLSCNINWVMHWPLKETHMIAP